MTPEERKRRATARATLGEIQAADVSESMRMIRRYAKPYRDLLARSEMGSHLVEMVTGLTSDLERKSVEPIAVMHGVDRRTLEHFVGGSRWAWEPLLERLRSEVKQEIGADDAALVIDGSATPKKGNATVGVARQWCGRLGKQDNCVIGVYAAYVGRDDFTAIVAAELFLPRDWAEDEKRRAQVYVPPEVTYRTQPAIGTQILRRMAAKLPFAWVLADDEFGRTRAFRDAARALLKSYVVDVPRDTVVRRVRRGTTHALERRRWEVQDLRRRIPVASWEHFHIRDGEKGPIRARATMLPIATEREGKPWVQETLVIIETLDGSERWYCLAHGPPGTPLSEFVRRAKLRHKVEETFEECKGEVGLDHFETRTWQGWHHHMSLCIIAHWFLVREKRRLGKKTPGPDDQHDSQGDRSTLLSANSHPRRESRELPSRSQRGVSTIPLSSPRTRGAAKICSSVNS
jgi:SRSO17 transposase